jgi:hypothetical protein
MAKVKKMAFGGVFDTIAARKSSPAQSTFKDTTGSSAPSKSIGPLGMKPGMPPKAFGGMSGTPPNARNNPMFNRTPGASSKPLGMAPPVGMAPALGARNQGLLVGKKLGMKKGGTASARADGIVSKGKTRGKMV